MGKVGRREILSLDASAVIRHFYEGLSAARDLHGDLRGARIDGVFHELLDDGIGTVDDLPRRDLIVDFCAENMDLHESFSFHSEMRASA